VQDALTAHFAVKNCSFGAFLKGDHQGFVPAARTEPPLQGRKADLKKIVENF
jgi:hypothetical protein